MICCTWLLAAGRQRAGQHETKKKHARPAAFCQLKWRPHCCALLNRQARKDKPEKTGSGRVFLGFPKKDKPEKTGRVGSAEIGGKTGSGRVRVGVDPTLVEPLVLIFLL